MKIANNLSIHDSEIKLKFTRSSGPGGQNVNKVSSAVELNFNLYDSKSISPEIKARLANRLKGQLNNDGHLILKSDKYRMQNLNRKEVTERFKKIMIEALKKPRPRIPTKPSMSSVARRLSNKSFTGKLKKNRKIILSDLI